MHYKMQWVYTEEYYSPQEKAGGAETCSMCTNPETILLRVRSLSPSTATILQRPPSGIPTEWERAETSQALGHDAL